MSLKALKLCLQGGGSDEALAHAIDTDDVVTPPTAVSDCLGARTAKNRQTGKGCLGQGVQTPLLAFI